MKGGGMHIVTSLKELKEKEEQRGEINHKIFRAEKERLKEREKVWRERFQIDCYKAETTFRFGLAFLIGHILAVVSIPKVIPPTFSYIPIILVECLFTAPLVLFTWIGVFPGILLAVLFILAFGTMLLAAAAISNGVLMAVFSVYAFWTVSVYFGERYNKTWKMGQNLLALAALFVLCMVPLFDEVPSREDRLEIVRQLWKQQGVDNEFAVIRNAIISICWGLAVIGVVILLPPIRTARTTIAEELVPGLLKQTVAVITGKLDKKCLGPSANVLQQGRIAGMALFEPPVPWSKHGFLVPELAALVSATDKLILKVIALETAVEEKFILPEDMSSNKDTGLYKKETSVLLMAVAKVLASNKTDDVADLEQFAVVQDPASKFASGAECSAYESALLLRKAALNWLHAFDPSPDVARPPLKQRASDFFKKEFKIWILAPFVDWPLTMLIALTYPFRPNTWNVEKWLWKIKRCIGAIILFAMVVYWPAYANFAINREEWQIGAVYYGWDMLGYCNSWRPTMEGSFKKGLQRILGTCFGGLFAWLGIIVCSGSYSDDAPINPYGLVAYLTTVTTLCAFFSYKTGVGARFGVVFDSYYFFCYTLVIASLLALEVYLGYGTKNGLVVNRIVATITGVVMNWIVVVIPPFVKGGDPKHSYECIVTLNESFLSLLKTYANNSEWAALGPKDVEAKFLQPAEAKYEYADFVLKDADMYDSVINMYAPKLTNNPGLAPLLADIGVTTTFLGELIKCFEEIKDGQEETLRASVSSLLNIGLDRVSDEEAVAVTKELTELQGQARVLIRIIHARLQKHKLDWDAIVGDNLSLVQRVDALERQRDELSRELARYRTKGGYNYVIGGVQPNGGEGEPDGGIEVAPDKELWS